MQSVRRHAALLVLLGLYVVLGTIYSIVDPVFEASDELNHFPFVAYLVHARQLPVQIPGQETLWGQEGSQPPLFYAAAAALTSFVDTADLPERLYLNPHADRGVPGAPDNKNMIIHTSGEDFPWRGTTLAVHLIRLFSVLLGAGTVLCTYALTLHIFPEAYPLALGASAINAFIPMFLFISASVNNDNLVVLLSSLALLLLVRAVLRPPSRRLLLSLGVVCGLACLSKLGALGLLPLCALGLAGRRVIAYRRRAATVREVASPAPFSLSDLLRSELPGWLGECLLIGLPVLAIAGWWYVRNWELYGDFLGLNTMLAIAGRRPVTPTVWQLLDEFEGFRINFWGLFGAVNVLMQPTWIYHVLDALALVALAGLPLWVARNRRNQSSSQWLALALLATWILVEFVAVVRWTMATAASQGRLLFPAISAIAVLLALGLSAWLPARYRFHGLYGFVGLLFVLAVAAPFTAIRAAYPRPALLTPDQIPASAHAVNFDYGGALRLLAFETHVDQARPGMPLKLDLYWQAPAGIEEDYSISVKLSSSYQGLAQHDTYPAGGAYPTSLWTPGEVLRDTHMLMVAPDAPSPVPALLTVGVYRRETMEPLPVRSQDGQPVLLPVLQQVKVVAPQPTLIPQHSLDANLNNQVRLIGFDVPPDALVAGHDLPLTLYWASTNPLDRDYTVFVHLVDAQEHVGGQADGPPADGAFPSSKWMPGTIVKDIHRLEAEKGIPAGTYRVFAGLYDRATGARLPVVDAQGQPIGDRVYVTDLRVAGDR